MGEDVPVRNMQDGNTGGHLVKAAADLGFLDIQNAPVKVVMIPETAFQGPIDEEPQHFVCVRLRGFIEVHRLFSGVHCSLCHGAFPLFYWTLKSNGSTKYPARSSRRNTIKLIDVTGNSRQPFFSASTASRYTWPDA